MMGEEEVRKELGLPGAVRFRNDMGGGRAHIVSVFGDTWCTDRFDEETGDYRTAPELAGIAIPMAVEQLCPMCVEAAREDE